MPGQSTATNHCCLYVEVSSPIAETAGRTTSTSTGAPRSRATTTSRAPTSRRSSGTSAPLSGSKSGTTSERGESSRPRFNPRQTQRTTSRKKEPTSKWKKKSFSLLCSKDQTRRGHKSSGPARLSFVLFFLLQELSHLKLCSVIKIK